MLLCDGLNVDSVASKRKRSPGLDGNETDEESCESEKTVSKKKKRSCAQEEREEQVKDTVDKLRNMAPVTVQCNYAYRAKCCKVASIPA